MRSRQSSGEILTTKQQWYMARQPQEKKLLIMNLVKEYAEAGSLCISAEEICISLLEMILRHMKDASGEGMIADQQAYVDWLSDRDVLVVEGPGDIQSKYRLERYVTMALGQACLRGTRVLYIGPTYLDDALEKLTMSDHGGADHTSEHSPPLCPGKSGAPCYCVDG